MPNKTYYTVRKGRETGIFTEWEEVKLHIEGYSKADFKKFNNKKEAIEYLNEEVNEDISNKGLSVDEVNESIEKQIEELDNKTAIAFVDGSYGKVDDMEKYGFGAVIFTANNKKNILYKAFVDDKYMKFRNVSGEIEGVKEVILWALDKDLSKILIYYDYDGIEEWATKEWKAKTRISREYVRFYEENKEKIDIEFIHSKAHSGIIYNEEADALAKQSLRSQNYKTYNDDSVYFYCYSKKDWYDIVNDINNKELWLDEIHIYEINQKDYHDILKLETNEEKVTINCYGGNKSYLQGKQGKLYEKVMFYAIENLPNENIVIQTLNKYHVLDKSKKEIEAAFNEKIPNFPKDNEDQKHYNNLLTAVFNTMLVGYMPDFTSLLHPISRSTEYYLHRILGDKLGNKTTTQSGANNFSFFNRDENGEYYYNRKTKGIINERQLNLLNRFYNYYATKRNPHMHWSKESIDTKVVESLSEAVDIIDEGLGLIKEYYKLF